MMKNGSRRIPAERKRSPASTGEPDMDNASVGIYIQIKAYSDKKSDIILGLNDRIVLIWITEYIEKQSIII